jgi:hypothetical protein
MSAPGQARGDRSRSGPAPTTGSDSVRPSASEARASASTSSWPPFSAVSRPEKRTRSVSGRGTGGVGSGASTVEKRGTRRTFPSGTPWRMYSARMCRLATASTR